MPGSSLVWIEEWCVDAETPEEARALLAAGQGYRCRVGDRLNVELTTLHDSGRHAPSISG
jgi:hypothetical protein